MVSPASTRACSSPGAKMAASNRRPPGLLGHQADEDQWGTCNPSASRIWLNLELAKKPVQCLEYLIVHELVHLVERHHNERFISLMDRHLPHWRRARTELN